MVNCYLIESFNTWFVFMIIDLFMMSILAVIRLFGTDSKATKYRGIAHRERQR